jgi:glutamate-ammonia-ligase adenylyltransferase
MPSQDIRHFLDHPEEVRPSLAAWGLHDTRRAHRNLVRMAEAGVTLDLLADICGQLAEHLPRLSDADMALNNLERFVTAARNPLSLAALFERDREALPVLLLIFSMSQHLSDLLVTDSESYDLLRLTEGQPVARQTLVEELCAEVAALAHESTILKVLRRFKRRETLRICYGDMIRGQSLQTVTAQISYVADASLEAALLTARRKLTQRRGQPRLPGGGLSRFVVLGMGKLGGVELNYSSDIDLIFLYEADGMTDGPKPVSNAEFFGLLAKEVVTLLTEQTELGQAFRVDLRLRPDGAQGASVHSLEQALRYYDLTGRTWERQAYVKARPVAGDLDFGREFLKRLEPWIYQRYLGLADIAGIKALKRRIEQRAGREGGQWRNVKTGRGGIRDVEFVIQFLQLLNGADQPEVRTSNTLEAIDRLERIGCLTHQERTLLEKNYTFLRNIEHRLQIMFDLQTHQLPEDSRELRKVAIRLGFQDSEQATALDAFQREYRQATAINRKILDHLLHDAFADDALTQPEVDLVLDPDPPRPRVAAVLSKYGFKDPALAYKNLTSLSKERIRFLSTRRCRHFLASIAPTLLAAVAATPDPDSTLVNLEKVSDSLGGKGVLWELFSFNPPSLHLYVELCATSPFLSGMLISNPGMIDELMDSLVLDKLPTLEVLRSTLNELCRGAEDLDLALHTFKNTQQLHVGVRDILGKEDVQATTAALSNIALVCLEQIARTEYAKLVERWGQPQCGVRSAECGVEAQTDDPTRDNPQSAIRNPQSEFVILALGKFGGAELNYHSDLDLVFLYESEGETAARSRRGHTTTNRHFFSELGQRIIKAATHLGPYGRLYDLDPRLRPTGKSGALATSLAEFSRYFASGEGQLWERQALCKARVVYASPTAAGDADEAVNRAAFSRPWTDDDARAIRHMRARLEETAAPRDIKRGRGGMVDVEFLVQMLQLRHGGDNPRLRVPNTLQALSALREAGHLPRDDYEFFAESYRFLRRVESRLRLLHTGARDELPEDPAELAKLARGLGVPTAEGLLADCMKRTSEIRRRFETYFV